MAEETGWLIEAADETPPGGPLYWAGSFGDERDRWTQDHARAVWFCRKQDAEAVADGVLRGYTIRVCDHIWMDTAT